ncbi:MAG: Na+/H+ antiporter NhaC [Bacteroidota bacterium]|jgi:NhaC family Na+:H+ antiporter|nr:Na+/H+ antiporter NhaC [Bacteroidota bacterium]|tara:strand:- start:105 stop:1538 length:1434 start_codon:yes stop_codon:yes gene_type:complete
MNKIKSPTTFQALVPIIFLVILLSINVSIFGDDSLSGSIQIVLILSSAVASIIAFNLGFSWLDIQKGIIKSINSSLPSILILFLVGSLAGSWLLSGVVPAFIYYGIQILNAKIFLFAACVICIVVSMATGSSWTTSATIGIALIGIGRALDISDGLVAGAILSGAYFGDKMSPLSDTTNLAPAMAGSDLISHIKYLSLTTVPSIIISLVIFIVLGFNISDSIGLNNAEIISSAIKEKFYISPVLFIVPLTVIILIYNKIKAVPALFVGVILGSVFALIFQSGLVVDVSNSETLSSKALFSGTMISLYGSISINTSNPLVTDLLSSSGMFGMLDTIWLVICAMIFGGVMEKAGFLKQITSIILNKIKSSGSLISSTAGTCIFFNLTASDQYLSIVVPGKMYSSIYKEKGLAPENLSRTLEDGGTVTSVLVPWNTCGAYHASVLNVATLTYLPFCFFNLISPIMTILFAYLKIKIKRIA